MFAGGKALNKYLRNRSGSQAMIVVLTTVLPISCAVAGADFDGDSKADVFVVSGGAVHRYEATGQIGGLDYIPEAFGGGYVSVGVGNVDNDADGRGDLMVSKGTGMIWWEPLAENSIYFVNSLFGSGVQANGIAIGSEADGSSDLFLRRSDALTQYENYGDNSVKWITSGITSGVQCLAAGDLNHDSGYDLLVGRSSNMTWYQSQNGVLTAKQHHGLGDLRAMAIGDLDGDVYSDLLAVVNVAGVNRIRWYEASGTSSVTLTEVIPSITDNSGFSSIAIGDIDGDGMGELLATQSLGPVRWFVCNGNNSITELSVPAFGENADGIAIASSDPIETWPMALLTGDISGDGEVDSDDIGALAEDWLKCTDTNDADCVAGVDSERVKVVDSWVVTTNSEDLNFPQFRISQTGAYAIGYGTGSHGATGWFKMRSTDEGESWALYWTLPGLLATLEMDGGMTISMGYSSAATSDPKVLTNAVTQSLDNWAIHDSYTSTLTFPFDVCGFAFVRSMILAANGSTIYAAGQGCRSDKAESMMLQSDDLGLTWTYRSTIAARTEEWMGQAGPSETAMVRLTNGNLLAAMRTGSMALPGQEPPATCPMAYVISTDDGATWGTPVNMQCTGVFPDMVVLENGTVVLLSGRPGVYVRLATPDGMTWSEPFYIYEGTGCANSSMQLGSDGMPVIVYTETDFCGYEYPGYTNYIKMAKLQIDGSCGIGGYSPGDINHDCVANMLDFCQISQNWLDVAAQQ